MDAVPVGYVFAQFALGQEIRKIGIDPGLARLGRVGDTARAALESETQGRAIAVRDIGFGQREDTAIARNAGELRDELVRKIKIENAGHVTAPARVRTGAVLRRCVCPGSWLRRSARASGV